MSTVHPMAGDVRAAVEAIAPRFRSGNRIPVDKAVVPAEEWHALVAALSAASAAEPQGWISVDQLPPSQTPVLLDIGRKHPIRAMWVEAKTLPAGGDDADEFGTYDEADDEWYCPAGWYEWNEHEDRNWSVSATPLRWMELPAPGAAVAAPGPRFDEDELYAVERAADLLEGYVEFIQSDVMVADIERHPYMPEVEQTARDLRELAGTGRKEPAPAGTKAIPATMPPLKDGKPRLDKPARVGGVVFRKGVEERLVIESAKRHFEAEAERQKPKTLAERQEEERNRRAFWDLVNGAPPPDLVAEDTGFSRGVCVALQVVTSMDQAVLWGEIVRACDAEKLVHFAADVEPEEWELAGFAQYAAQELGQNKPAAQAQGGAK
ncbi:MAG TPA: hypothetical protein VMS38_28730 [Pseudorhodoferax sp.]|nr:hypothetical protein [Pseudorhodoferax sp.]